MRLRAFVLLLVAACGKDTTVPDLGAAKVVIESVTLISDSQVRVTLKNEGGAGSFYVEVAGFNSIPNGDNAPRSQSAPVDVRADYRETVTYSASFDISTIRVFSRPQNSAVYTRTGCYYIFSTTHC